MRNCHMFLRFYLLCKCNFSMDMSLLETVITTFGVLLTMALLSCLCCICMKFSDLKLQRYIMEMAKRKGIHIDVEKLDPNRTRSPLANENCTIIVPDVAIIL
ncbi:uncharacterized protein LOC123662838 [Melitaea cinxia]|uniref:uncharacterized protein LOC123662838 n=1 Tax=Melitaea cinxia TaxID=113334 RepID=UPI001E27026D|nr:uncharacterized protein LOC123662838 [Melitaea cinxia]